MNEDVGCCKVLATIKCKLSLLDSSERTKKVKVQTRTPQGSAQKLEKATNFLESARIQKKLINQSNKYQRRLCEMKRHFLPDFKSCEAGTNVTECWKAGDFEMSVRVYRPHRASQPGRTVYPSSDIWVRNSQTLDELKDAITCANNDILVGDIYSTRPKAEVMNVKNLVTSGVFLFGNTFYTDLRDITNARYGDEIQTWMSHQPDYSCMKFHQATMEGSHFEDLTIRFGWPYVFIHLQKCEHLIRFTGARLLLNQLIQRNVNQYPMVIQAPPSVVYCGACQTHLSRWVVRDRLLPKKFMYFCHACFNSFYYYKGKRTERPFESHLFPQQDFPDELAESPEDPNEASTEVN